MWRGAAALALVAVNVAAIVILSSTWSRLNDRFPRFSFDVYRIDLDVYRIGSSVWRRGGDLYGQIPRTRVGAELLFTYPPIAAALFTPLTLMPFAVASVVLTVLGALLLGVVVAIFLRALGVPRRHLLWGVGLVLPWALFIEPVNATFSFGQINIVLMALVTADCLLPRTPWPRGSLVGLAGAIKLTPALFVLFFLVRRDLRSARNAVIAFAVTTLVGFALDPGGSVTYWTSAIFDSRRIGGIDYVGNQSMQGMLNRAGLSGAVLSVTWFVLSIGVVAVVIVGMRRALAVGQAAPALVLNAFGVLLISPISWSHHWVWIVPAILCFAALAWRSRTWPPLLLAVGALVVFFWSFQWRLPQGGGRELDWRGIDQIVGSGYTWFALLTIAVAAWYPAMWTVRRPAPVPAAPPA